MRTIAAASIICLASAFTSDRLVVPGHAAPVSLVRAVGAGKTFSSVLSVWLRAAPSGETAVAFQNTPGGQAGNPSVLPAPASAPRIRPGVPLEMPRRVETIGAKRSRTIHLEEAPLPLRVDVQLATQLSSATSRVGDTWQGTLARELVLHGQTIARAGDQVTGRITFVRSQARWNTPGQLTLRLTAVNGHPVSSSAVRPGAVPRRDGAAPGTGALIGGLAGAGNGAAIGATAGSGAGKAAPSPENNKREVVLPAKSILTFTLTDKAVSRK